MRNYCLLVARMRADQEDDAVLPHEYLLLRTPQVKERRGANEPGEETTGEEEEEEEEEEEGAGEDNIVGRGSLADLCVGNGDEENATFGKIVDKDGKEVNTHKGFVISRFQCIIRCTRLADGSLNWTIRDPFSTFRTCLTNDIFDKTRIERKHAYALTLGSKVVVQGYTPRSQKYVLHFMTEEEAIRLLSLQGSVPVPRNKYTINASQIPVLPSVDGLAAPIINTIQDGPTTTKREADRDGAEEPPRAKQRKVLLELETSDDDDDNDIDDSDGAEEPPRAKQRKVLLELETSDDDDDNDIDDSDDDEEEDEDKSDGERPALVASTSTYLLTYLLQNCRTPPQYQLQVGDDVECSELTLGYRGSWSRARILNFTANGVRCEVEYYDLLDDNQKNCKEWKDVKNVKVFRTGDTGITRSNQINQFVYAVRPAYPYDFVKPPLKGETWPLGTIVDGLWNDIWWKGEVVETSKMRYGKPQVRVRFVPPPDGEGGPMLWLSMDKTRRSLVWDTDHKAIEKYRRERGGRILGKELHIGSWAEDTVL